MCAIGLNLAEFLMMRPASNGPSELALAQVNQKGSLLGGDYMSIPKRQLPVLCWRNRMVRCGNGCRHHELLEPGGRKHEEIVIRGVARVTQLVRDIARGQQRIAWPENKGPLSDGEGVQR